MKFFGHLTLRAESRAGGKTVLAKQAFRAPFHISKTYSDDHALLVQIVNPTAGVLEGDRLESDVSVGRNASLLMTSPSATRVFRMREGAAESRQSFNVDTGGWLEFWPEPLVPHAGSDFTQRTEIQVAPEGGLFFADFLMPGRIARGEVWGWKRLVLELRVRVGADLILRERIEQSGEEMRELAQLANMGEAATFGTIVAIGPELRDEARWKDEVVHLHSAGEWLGVSRLRGDHPAYCIKMIAPDGDCLRRTHRKVREIVSSVLPALKADPRKL